MARLLFIMEEQILQTGLDAAAGFSVPTASAGVLDAAGLQGSFIEKWLMPGKVQQREFGQQVALQQMQNDWQSAENQKWNDEIEKMARLRKAGVNPLTAASAVAGNNASPNSPTSVGSVPSVPDGITPSDVVGAANAMTGGAASLADAAFKLGTLNPTIESLNADIEKKLSEKGFTDEQIYAWRIDNKYRDANAQIDLRIKGLNEQNIAKQWEVMHAQYELISTQIDTEIAKQRELYEAAKLDISQAGLADAEARYYNSLARKTSHDAEWQKIRIDFWKSQGFDIMNSSTDNILVQKLENGQSIKEAVKELSDYYEQRADAEQQAIENHAFNISKNSSLGKAYASWYERPNNMFGAVNDAAKDLRRMIDRSEKSKEEAAKELRKQSQFMKSYYNFRDDLLRRKNEAWEKLRSAGYTDEQYHQWYEDYKSLEDALEHLTPESYSDLLLNQY